MKQDDRTWQEVPPQTGLVKSPVAAGSLRSCDFGAAAGGAGLASTAVAERSVSVVMSHVRAVVMERVAIGDQQDLIAASLATLITEVLSGNANPSAEKAIGEWRVDSEAHGSPPASRYRFQRIGDCWDIQFGVELGHLRHLKGLGSIARLLTTPNVPVSAWELMGVAGDGNAVSDAREDALTADDGRGAPRVDRQTIREVCEALSEIPERIEAAMERGDFDNIDKLRDLEEEYKSYLGANTDKKGHPRLTAGDNEKARLAVKNGITSAIKAIGKYSPSMASHLDRSIETGSMVVYNPESPVLWEL